jgi:hypothetical protein
MVTESLNSRSSEFRNTVATESSSPQTALKRLAAVHGVSFIRSTRQHELPTGPYAHSVEVGPILVGETPGRWALHGKLRRAILTGSPVLFSQEVQFSAATRPQTEPQASTASTINSRLSMGLVFLDVSMPILNGIRCRQADQEALITHAEPLSAFFRFEGMGWRVRGVCSVGFNSSPPH